MARGWQLMAMVVATSIGVVVQLPGVMVDYAKVSQAHAAGRTEAERQWNWAASPFALNTRAMATAVPDNFGYAAGLQPVLGSRSPRSDSRPHVSRSSLPSASISGGCTCSISVCCREPASAIAIAAFVVWVVLFARGLGRELA